MEQNEGCVWLRGTEKLTTETPHDQLHDRSYTRVSWTIQITEGVPELVYLDGDDREKDFDEAQRSPAAQAPHQRQLLRSVLEKLLRLGGWRHRGAPGRTDCSDHRRRTGIFQKG